LVVKLRMPKSVLIAGCGFVGLPLARNFASSGWVTYALTATASSTANLRAEQFRAFGLDITEKTSFRHLPVRTFDVVIHCASSGRGDARNYAAVFFAGTRNLTSYLECGRFIFCSSTSVYAQIDGSWVDELSAADPERETGQILRKTEDLVLGSGGAVARFAGLYGPDRCAPLQKLLDGRATIEGDGTRVMNILHHLDAAGAIQYLAETGPSGLFNVVDNEPVTQIDWYRYVCQSLNKTLPPVGPRDLNRKRGWTSKRVSNRKLRSLGWNPIYPTFKEGLAAIIVGQGSPELRHAKLGRTREVE
jgi:nucleoside-diphosphate-sugar epimerase